MNDKSFNNMMMELNKPRRALAEDAGVKAARNRFKNVLKHMVQDNFLHEEESDSDNNDENRGDGMGGGGGHQGVGRLSGFRLSPTKKRKRSGSLTDQEKKPQASFVMKLFDRGVDLAQFDEFTPLYPICRAWMQNKPHLKQPRRDEDVESNTSDLEYQGETEEVYRLPAPEPLPYDEYGNQLRVREPPPLPRDSEDFDINYEDENAPSPALLFQNHLDRWNLIRQRWKEASAYNERRYDSSFTILRQIHDRVNLQISASQIQDLQQQQQQQQQQQEAQE